MNAADFIRGFNNPEAVKQVLDGPLPPSGQNSQEKKKDS